MLSTESLPESHDYLMRELDSISEADFKFKDVKEEILKEQSERNPRERQHNETLLASRARYVCEESLNSPRLSFTNKINSKSDFSTKPSYKDTNCRDKYQKICGKIKK